MEGCISKIIIGILILVFFPISIPILILKSDLSIKTKLIVIPVFWGALFIIYKFVPDNPDTSDYRENTYVSSSEEYDDKGSYSYDDTEEKEFEQPRITEPPKQQTVISNTGEYVLNRNSMKYHYPTCSEVRKMSEENKEIYTGTVDAIESQGFTPCGKCRPH